MNSDGSEPRLENEWYPDRYGDRHDPPSAIFFNTMQDIEKTLESKEFKEKFWEWLHKNSQKLKRLHVLGGWCAWTPDQPFTRFKHG